MANKIKIFLFVFLLVSVSLGVRFFPKAEIQSPATSQKQTNKAFAQAYFSDLHSDLKNLNEAVLAVNNDPDIESVVVLGDLTDLGGQEDLEKVKEILDKLDVKYWVIPGNHDVWYSRRYEYDHDYFFRIVFGKKTCAGQSDFDLVLIDNSDESQGISPEDWQAAQKCLEKPGQDLVFIHEPIYHPANDMIMGKYSDAAATQAAQLRDFFCQNQVQAVFAGHMHSFARYDYKCPDGHLLPMIVTPALTSQRNFQSPRFLKVEIYDDGRVEDEEVVLGK